MDAAIDNPKNLSLTSLQIVTTKDSRTFSQFLELPVELRIRIWGLAIPDGRVIRLDVRSLENGRDDGYLRSTETSYIPSILHVCRESREVGTSIFHLGFGSTTTEHARDWFNPEEDMVYIPSWSFQVSHELMLRCILASLGVLFNGRFITARTGRAQDDPDIARLNSAPLTHEYLDRVQHLAIPLTRISMGCLLGVKVDGLDKIDSCMWLWLVEFPHLESLTLIIEHFAWSSRDGETVLYEPVETPIRHLALQKPSDVQSQISHRLERFRDEDKPEWTVPTVEVLVAGIRKPHRTFCVLPPVLH